MALEFKIGHIAGHAFRSGNPGRIVKADLPITVGLFNGQVKEGKETMCDPIDL